MKQNKLLNFVLRVFSAAMAAVMLITTISTNVQAEDNNNDPLVVVSLGDSYSAGEGIEKFYFQDRDWAEKCDIYDFVAHRSENSWPGQIEINGMEMKYYKTDEKPTSGKECYWYFKAASGAETKHFKNEEQGKKCKWISGYTSGRRRRPIYKSDSTSLPLQKDVFTKIGKGVTDYVTLTMGGNDIGFTEVVTTVVLRSSYLFGLGFTEKSLNELLEDKYEMIPTVISNLKQMYTDIATEAGYQAAIVVAGYPKLFEKNGKGAAVSKEEATKVNQAVSDFNDYIEEAVNEMKDSLNIHFVDVEVDGRFNGHEAYSSDNWINPVWVGAKSQDLDCTSSASSYSIHPNATGAEHYAKYVSDAIKNIENNKGSLSGKIVKASDRSTPIPGASISIFKGENLWKSGTADSSGNYTLDLPAGRYRVEIDAPGYLKFTAYATINTAERTYMETFLMVEGEEGETGIATGHVYDALNGNPIPGVMLVVFMGWDNVNEEHESYAVSMTDANGEYSLELPLGNYTVYPIHDGYISSPFNIIVQSGTTGSQNGSMTPVLSDDTYRIVLTWGVNPRDLDSHVVGVTSSGNAFHVYYRSKSAYDGDIEVCNLDYDDTTSYGPETITLVPTTSSPYYYYVYKYAGEGTVGGSEAQVKVYKGEQLIHTLNVPTNMGDGDYWNVFAVVNGEIVLRNTITSSAEISYMNDESDTSFTESQISEIMNELSIKEEKEYTFEEESFN